MCKEIFDREDRLLTVANLAEALGARTHQVNYVIRKYGIEHSHRAGNARIFNRVQARQISEHVINMDSKYEWRPRNER